MGLAGHIQKRESPCFFTSISLVDRKVCFLGQEPLHTSSAEFFAISKMVDAVACRRKCSDTLCQHFDILLDFSSSREPLRVPGMSKHVLRRAMVPSLLLP